MLQINVSLEGQLNPVNPGTAPSVTTTGPETPGLNRFGTRVFEKLKAGLYNVSANVITINGNPYDPVIIGSPVSIGNGRAGTVNIDYRIRKGIVTVTVTGLKPGEKGRIHLTGPENRVLELPNGVHPIEVNPGDYTVTADPTADADPAVSAPSVTVRGGQTSPVTVDYKPAKGTISVVVRGLPNGEKANISLQGPQPVSQPLPNGTHAVKVPAGNYAVTAEQKNGFTVTVTPPSVNLNPRGNQTVTVDYDYVTTFQYGIMRFTVSGLASGEQGEVTVMGNSLNFSKPLPNGTFELKVPAGTYQTSAAAVNGKTPTVSPATSTVAAKGTAEVTVNYGSNGAGGIKVKSYAYFPVTLYESGYKSVNEPLMDIVLEDNQYSTEEYWYVPYIYRTLVFSGEVPKRYEGKELLTPFGDNSDNDDEAKSRYKYLKPLDRGYAVGYFYHKHTDRTNPIHQKTTEYSKYQGLALNLDVPQAMKDSDPVTITVTSEPLGLNVWQNASDLSVRLGATYGTECNNKYYFKTYRAEHKPTGLQTLGFNDVIEQSQSCYQLFIHPQDRGTEYLLPTRSSIAKPGNSNYTINTTVGVLRKGNNAITIIPKLSMKTQDGHSDDHDVGNPSAYADTRIANLVNVRFN